MPSPRCSQLAPESDLMLRRLASNLVQARLPSSVAALDRILDGTEATVSSVMGTGG
jgi:hypothetical protein